MKSIYKRSVSVLLLSVSLFFSAGYAQVVIENPDWFKKSFLDIEEDYAEASESGKGLMLYFHQEGCPYCKAFVDRILKSDKLGKRVQNTYDVVDFNIRGHREVTLSDGRVMNEAEFAVAAGIQFTPTVVFLRSGAYPTPQSIAYQMNGYYPPKEFEALLDQLQKQIPKTSDNSNVRFDDVFPELSKNSKLSKDQFLAVLMFDKSCDECGIALRKILDDKDNRDALKPYKPFRLVPAAKSYTTAADQMGLENVREPVYFPSIALFENIDGRYQEVFRMESQLGRFHFQSALEYVATGAYKKQPAFQRFIDERAARLRSNSQNVSTSF